MAKLGVLDINGTKHVLKLGESYLIGRKGKNCHHDIEIDDASVDVKHCLVDFSEQLVKLVDLKSKWGTFIGGKKLSSCQIIPLAKSTSIQIGNVETALLLSNDGDSGYLEGRVTPPIKDDSEFICDSPENVNGNRLKKTREHSIRSSPNISEPSSSTSTGLHHLVLSRRSEAQNDSFFVPETQCLPVNQSIHRTPTKRSSDARKSTDRTSTNQPTERDEDDYYIPETQEVVHANPRLSNYPRLAFGNDPINEAVVDDDKLPSSQFRICTQDFNDPYDNSSNNSDDILANVPCSLIIPAIRHSPVKIDEPLRRSGSKDADREMSNISFTQQYGRSRSQSVTPDNIDVLSNSSALNVFGANDRRSASQCTTPELLDAPEEENQDMDIRNDTNENESREELRQTQMFTRNLVEGNTLTRLSPPREISGSHHDSSMLAPTQKFIPPPLPLASVSLPSKMGKTIRPPPPSPAGAGEGQEEDLPPTQIFQGVSTPNPRTIVAPGMGFSSTFLDSAVHPTENSFNAKCDKLLDSDDDEMDEIVAPDLVSKLRENIKKLTKAGRKTPTTSPISDQISSTSLAKNIPADGKSTPSADPPEASFIVPRSSSKKNVRPQLVTRIDNYLLTPDFIGKEFTKDEYLQKEAENNWKKIMCQKHGKSLFRDEDSESVCSSTTDAETSQDSFTAFLKRPVNKSPNTTKISLKKKKGRPSKQSIGERLSRHRQSITSMGTSTKVTKKTEKFSLKKDKTIKKGTKKDSSGESDEKKIKSPSPTLKKPVRTRSRRLSEGTDKEKKSATKSVIAGSSEELRYITRQSPFSHNTRHSEGASTSCKRKEEKASSTSSVKDKSAAKVKRNTPSKELNKDQVAKDKREKNGGKKDEEKAKQPRKKETKREEKAKHSSNKEAKEDEKTKQPARKNKQQRDTSQPGLRVTRLRSCLDATPSSSKSVTPPAVDNLCKRRNRLRSHEKSDADMKKVDSKSEAPVRKKLSQKLAPAIDLTINCESDDSSPLVVNSKQNGHNQIAAAPNPVKRKIECSSTRSKRFRSTGSSDSVKSGHIGEKKHRNERLKIAMTMCDPRYLDILEKHSGTLWTFSKDPTDCDVLVVENGNRTYKILVAIARGIPIVNIDWLIEVLRSKTTDVACDKFIFENDKFQQRHHFEMKKSLQLARRKPVFAGLSFMMTPNIRPVPQEMSDIITCAGGNILDSIPKQHANQRLYLVSHESDKHLWHYYRRENSHFKIVTSEGVMASVMQQSEHPLIKSAIA